jgi:hypothetical protein
MGLRCQVSRVGFQRSGLETSLLEPRGSVELNGAQRLNPSMELGRHLEPLEPLERSDPNCCLLPRAYWFERFERLELLEPLERLKQQSVTKPQTHRPWVHTN